MGTIATFLGNHWIIFLIIAIILVFALIGYIVDSKSIEEDKGEIIGINTEPKVEVLKDMENKTLSEVTQSNIKEKIVENTKTEETENKPLEQPKENQTQQANQQQETVEKKETETLTVPKQVEILNDIKPEDKPNVTKPAESANSDQGEVLTLDMEENNNVSTFKG